MDPAMLTCSICPGQPDYSDVSHLLTHVSSKGHLAHLHKLQVKSHQEIAAAVQLQNYNQWYQQYGLANLLSDRLQQKELKQSSKNAAMRKIGRQPKTEDTTYAQLPPLSIATHPPHNQGRARARVNKRESLEELDDDLDYDPNSLAKRPRPNTFLTPVKDYPELPSPPRANDFSPDLDPNVASSPSRKAVQLKGRVWPGMAMFDAATPTEARRRNQKKDGSVLRRMEKLAEQVEPQETVYNAAFEMRKQRHIDDLEDTSSLIDGETPVVKPKPRVKRKALARISSNRPRRVKKEPKVARPRRQRQTEPNRRQRAMSEIPSSAVRHGDELVSAFTPSVDEPFGFQLPFDLSGRKKMNKTSIYHTHASPTNDLNRYSAYAPVQQLGTGYAPGPPKLFYANAPWLQPQNQNPIYMGNHAQVYRPAYNAYQPLQDASFSKQNAVPPTERDSGATQFSANPLTWKSPQAPQDNHSSDPSFGSFSGYFASTSGLADPFGYTRNPLFDALSQFDPIDNTDITKTSVTTEDRSTRSPKEEAVTPVDSQETISEPTSKRSSCADVAIAA